MIRWLWDRMLKWGWDFSRRLDDLDNNDPVIRLRNRVARHRNEALVIEDSDSGLELPDPITFRVQAVNGGTLVETRWYDAKTDNQIRKLHIVTGEENLGEAVGKIVTMELLKR
jgi:hypothetical protein